MTVNYYAGRTNLIKLGTGLAAVTIGGFRTTDVNIDTGAIDVTNKNSAGYQEMLMGGGIAKYDVSGQGVFDNSDSLRTLIAAANPGGTLQALTIIYGNGDTYSGNFAIKTLKRSGPYNTEETYDFAFSSSGTIAFAPGA